MMATQLFGFFPRSDANDPESFIIGAAAMLARYPEAVTRAVCDPVRGLPSTNKFLPAISEIRDACERQMVWHDAVEKRDREREHTHAVLAGHKAPVGSPEHRRVVKDFKDLAALWPRSSGAPKTEPKDHTRVPPQLNTPEMADYLARMREGAGGEEVSGP